ncbi:MAG: Crp/Fnr family transcriptional regulator [Anaerolineales bacterium]
MVSPELLRRYQFFSLLTDQQLKDLAMLSEEIRFADKEDILREGEPADALYFLIEGCVDLYYTVVDAYYAADRKQVLVGEINPGEPFGISALVEPYELTSTARSSGASRVMKISRDGVHDLFADDPAFEILFLRRVARAALDRLNSSRIQLAAAWA